MKRAGFSLLEVILALAILAGSLAVIGEASRHALRNAEMARDMARAQLLCETKLAEIVTGVIAAEPIENAPFDATTSASLDPDEPAWLYSIETEQTAEEGLIVVRVSVTRDLPPERHPVRVSLVRWMADPSAAAASSSDTSDTNSNTGASSGESRGGSSQSSPSR